MQDYNLLGTAIFTILICAKHVFVYAAPVVGVYYLRRYCFHPATLARGSIFRWAAAAKMAGTAATIFILALAPILLSIPPPSAQVARCGALQGSSAGAVKASQCQLGLLERVQVNAAQLQSRLFPWERGLCHAYWAPNVWALYNSADKLLTVGLTVADRVSGGRIVADEWVREANAVRPQTGTDARPTIQTMDMMTE